MGKRSIIKISLGCLGLINLLALSCPTFGLAHAEDNMTATKEQQTIARVLARPVLSVALSPSVLIDIVPRATGSFNVGLADLTVSTNSRNGFSVLMSATSGTDMSSHTTTDKIATLPSDALPADFANNSWGYYIGKDTPGETTTYHPIPSTNTEIASTETSNDSQAYKVAFGVKINNNLSAGMYSNAVIISVVANPVDVGGIHELTYMQDISPEICAVSKIWESDADSTTLVDARDNKEYKVARLKDGNCWMQENLKLALSTDKALTPDDSDVTKNWVPLENTRTNVNTNPNNIASWNLSQRWYYQWDTATAGTGANANDTNGEATGSICPKGWKLPLGGESNNSVNGSFYYLLDKYNATSKSSMDIVLAAPLSFVREGYVQGTGNNNISDFASYWSRTTAAKPFAFYFQGGVYPSYAYDRSYGFSVRCMAIGAEE